MPESANNSHRAKGGWGVTILAAAMLAVSAPISNIFMGEENIFPPAVGNVLNSMQCRRAAYEGEDVYSVVVDLSGGRYAIVQTTLVQFNGKTYLHPGLVLGEGFGPAPCGHSIDVATLFEKAERNAEVCVDFANLAGTPSAPREEIGSVYWFYAARQRGCVIGDLKQPLQTLEVDRN